MASTDIVNYLQPGADTDVLTVQKTETFIATEAIAANRLVSLDLSQSSDGNMARYVSLADTGTATDKAPVGFALDAAAAAGDEIRVVVRGICEAFVAGATVAGDYLTCGATPGQAAVYANTDALPIIAVASEADTGNIATVYVYPQY